MALKNYEWRGFTWQFEESEAPADARPMDAPKAKAARQPADKAAKQPANKSRAAAKKAE